MLEARPTGTINLFGLNQDGTPRASLWESIGWIVASGAGAASAYHGYKRNKSVGWAIGWSMFGFFAPFLAVPIALAQGFGKEKRK